MNFAVCRMKFTPTSTWSDVVLETDEFPNTEKLKKTLPRGKYRVLGCRRGEYSEIICNFKVGDKRNG